MRKPTLRRILLALAALCVLNDSFHYLHLRTLENKRAPPQSHAWKIFIASTHWNNAYILKNHWNRQVVQIAKNIGPQNVFVSVYESGSRDDSKGALRDLSHALQALHVPNRIILDPTTHEDEIGKSPAASGWVNTPRGTKELRRIPYLSKLRNLSLAPLAELYENGTRFDKILFLNDVVFDGDDVLRLLDTNAGRYAAACSLDFSKPPRFYDTFALRDSAGHEALMQTWPYFRSRRSRDALKAGMPALVSSCWNGMVVMDAAPFYRQAQPLRFRGIPDSLAELHLEGSECCLIHQDNPLTGSDGVWLNPNVRVGYSKAAYDSMLDQAVPHSIFTYLKRVWENRLRRWLTTDRFKQWVVYSRLSAWRSLGQGEDRGEMGSKCLINEMQVLVKNGWAHL